MFLCPSSIFIISVLPFYFCFISISFSIFFISSLLSSPRLVPHKLLSPSEPEPPQTKPSFLSRLEPELSIPHGQPLFLKCKVEGYPPPKITWYKDGNPIRPSSSALPFMRGGEASLEVPQALEKDSGVYSCVAANPLGQDSTSCNVAVAGLYT